MPQMSPYNWIMMFMMFNLIMTIFSSYINFIKIPFFSKMIFFNKKNYIWKW